LRIAEKISDSKWSTFEIIVITERAQVHLSFLGKILEIKKNVLKLGKG